MSTRFAKGSGPAAVAVLAAGLSVIVLMQSVVVVEGGRCKKTVKIPEYVLTIGLLASSVTNLTTQRWIQEHIQLTGIVQDCFSPPHYLMLPVTSSLHIHDSGWTKIKEGIKKAMTSEREVPKIIIGPFYTNLAMILERENITYLITDYKGFDWIDMSRVQDTTPWRTLVELRPPAQQQNLAVVDLFRANDWSSAVMVMPENAADNQECQDLASQMLGAGVSLIPYTLDPRAADAREVVLQVLRNVRLFRQLHVIVCSPRDPRDRLIWLVLDMARLFDLTINEEQVFMLVDHSSSLQPMSTAQAMYNLGLFSARCQLLAFRYVQPTKGQGSPDADKATAIDAARVTTMALNDYLVRQKERIDTFDPHRFLAVFKQVYLPYGNTGALQFNDTGQRVNYKLHLYNHGGSDMYKKIAEWSPVGDSPGVRLNLTGFEDDSPKTTQYGIFPKVVKVVVVEEEPFVMLPKAGMLAGEGRYVGFTIDLLNRLSRDLKFRYEIYLSPHNAYGGPRSDGSWDGMVGEILNGNATLAAGAISITSSRERVMDFSLGVLSTGVNILIKKPEENISIFQFMMPFSLELWMAILGSSALVSLIFFVMDYNNHADRRFTAKETVWFCIGTIMKRGTDFAPVPVSQRVMTAGFTFFVLITVSTYTANMAAFLTTKNLDKTIDSFQMLSEDDSMGCGTVDNSATMNFFKRGTKPVFRRLWQKIQRSGGLVPNATAGRVRVEKGGYAFLFDYLINSYFEMRYCETTAVASPILIQEHGLGMREGAPFKTSINIALLKLKEDGFLQALKKRWWSDRRTCDDVSKTRSDEPQFRLKDMAGVFILGLLGLGAALALFCFKKAYFLARGVRHRGPDQGHASASKQTLESPGPAVREKERLCQNNTSFV